MIKIGAPLSFFSFSAVCVLEAGVSRLLELYGRIVGGVVPSAAVL